MARKGEPQRHRVTSQKKDLLRRECRKDPNLMELMRQLDLTAPESVERKKKPACLDPEAATHDPDRRRD